jgi:hypothetical protein
MCGAEDLENYIIVGRGGGGAVERVEEGDAISQSSISYLGRIILHLQ